MKCISLKRFTGLATIVICLFLSGCDQIETAYSILKSLTSDPPAETTQTEGTTPAVDPEPEESVELEGTQSPPETLQDTLPDKTSEQNRQLMEKRHELAMREREAAVDEPLGSLVLPSGKVYEQAVITKVTDVGISIRHAYGSARVKAEDLPEPFHQRFQFNSEKATALIRKEQQHLLALESADNISSITPKKETSSPRPKSTSSRKVPEQETTSPQGWVNAKPIRYRNGAKEVEFTVHTNCKARLTIKRIYPYGRNATIRIEPGKRTITTRWMLNHYSATLVSSDGTVLDEEGSTRKSGLRGSSL